MVESTHCHSAVVVVVGSLHSLLMVVVGPHGWWLFCSLPLVRSGNGPLPSFVWLVCCHHLLLLSIGGVMSLPVVLMMMDNKSLVIHPLIAMSPSAMWHLPGARSLAGASDMALQGCSCCYGVQWWLWVINGGCAWWW